MSVPTTSVSRAGAGDAGSEGGLGGERAADELGGANTLHPSWRRSAALGLRPDTAGPDSEDLELSRARRLRAAAEPVMSVARDSLRDSPVAVVLADQRARLVDSAAEGSRVWRLLRRRGVEEGINLSEEKCGNNGIGTVLETRRDVFLDGEQHFAEVFHDFSCYGLPVVNPLTNRVVGALDLSFLRGSEEHSFALPFLRQLALSIGARYVETAPSADRDLYHGFLEAKRNSSSMTCAFGEETVLVSRRGLDLLSSADLGALREAAESGSCPERMSLSIGEVDVRSSTYGRTGRLLQLDIAGARRERRPREAPAARGTTLAVVGPAGSGRTSKALACAGPGAQHVRIAEADDAATAWSELVVPALRGPGPVVLDDIDLLADTDLRRLRARVGSAAVRVVCTSYDDARPAVHAVLDSCDRRARIPALSTRGEEAPAIVRSLVSEICADRGVPAPVVTEQFAREACALELPNNLTSLRAVLATCLEGAPRLLEPGCLPAGSRNPRVPRQGELARGEFDAIVRALEDCGGVRSRAAKRLGISRTTLYARIREFGLD
ncbi:helix-turn-helix domain-containing protein [Dietzia sp.]|uniref:helix-turn-helix domain-containing protein n=1 Tax=Dietzia sp. TaxID=1871616 RepID=UPI002FD9C8B4